MDPRLRIVTKLPLEELWNTEGSLRSARVRPLAVAEIRALLSTQQVRFVVANAGMKLRWVDLEDRFEFWKREARARIADSLPFLPEDFPDGIAYRASLWQVEGEPAAVVLLEGYH
jgi:hypothetical protein